MLGILRAWTVLAESQPLLTLTVTNGTLGGVGDLLAQFIESHNNKKPMRWDYKRTLRFVAWGAICAPVFHKWYLFLNKQFPLPSIQTQGKRSFVTTVSKRVATDQGVYAPLGVAGFFIAMNYMEGGNWMSAKTRLREYYWPTLCANYAVWPAVQAINFGFVPTIYRVPFSSIVSIFWNAFISWTNAQSISNVDVPVETPHTQIRPRHGETLESKV
ncbi:hypothetical protein BX070DRAFT_219123 [Coemansia spiralis]|nr:hypothetical protein BX070DRAFT_219123 [Coemansia spiralis]